MWKELIILAMLIILCISYMYCYVLYFIWALKFWHVQTVKPVIVRKHNRRRSFLFQLFVHIYAFTLPVNTIFMMDSHHVLGTIFVFLAWWIYLFKDLFEQLRVRTILESEDWTYNDWWRFTSHALELFSSEKIFEKHY